MVMGHALVDEADYEAIAQVKWRLKRDARRPWEPGIAVRGQRIDGRFFTLAMSREVLGLTPGDGLQGDHINHDTLDNRRANLRIATNALNCQNKLRGKGRSPFRGVSWFAETGQWMAKVGLDYHRHYLGIFDTDLEAARAAEAFRREHMPFALPDPALQEALAA